MENVQNNQEKLIGLLIHNKDAVDTFVEQQLNVKYFDSKYKNIVEAIFYSHVNNSLLTRASFSHYLTSYKKLPPNEIAGEINIFTRCILYKGEINDLHFLLEDLKEYYISIKTNDYLNLFKEDKKKIGNKKAVQSLSDRLANLSSESSGQGTSFIDINSEDIKKDFLTKLNERRNNPEKRLICNIPEIDETMTVGFKPGHLTLFCADIGSFKTTIMVNIVVNIFKQSNQQANILYIPIEMPYDEILNKIISRETKVPIGYIEHADKLTEEQIDLLSKEFDKWSSLGNKFSIMDVSETTTVSLIKREIEKRINYFKPNIVVVDYVDNITPEKNRHRSDEEMKDILETLRKIGKKHGFHILSAAQLTREALKKLQETKDKRAGSTDIRGGQVMAATADTVYAQWRDPSNPAENLILTCIKARHGKPLFEGNKEKAVLKVQPEISYIFSGREALMQNWQSNKELLNEIGNVPPVEDYDAPF